MNVSRIARLAVFTALALIIHTVESFIPIPVPVPGVKLGLSNVVTLYMLFSGFNEDKTKRAPASDALAVLIGRIILGAVITGRLTAVFYSATGGLLAFAVVLAVRRFVSVKQIWASGVLAAIFHNIGQIAAACLITGTPAIALYLPVLIIAGIFTGAVTGSVAQILATKRIT